MTQSRRTRLILLGRPGCGLCEEFRDALEQAYPGRFELIESDVDSNPVWQRRHGLQIPVLLDETGAVLCATHFAPDALAGLL